MVRTPAILDDPQKWCNPRERIYHHYEDLEEYHAGMWRVQHGDARNGFLNAAADLMRQPEEFQEAMRQYNVYPIYDWRTEDLWHWHALNPDKPYNKLYDLMYKAGLSIHQMRICQPYGDDQRRGLWLFHLIEPETWARVVARVNGANGGALYMQEWGNINGYRRITKPAGHTWRSFAELLINSMPPTTKEHYHNKVLLFEKWWIARGYPNGIPDEAAYEMEAARRAPSWRRVCKMLLRNDWWGKSLGFSQQKSAAYQKYLDLMRKRKSEWGINPGKYFVDKEMSAANG